VHVFTQKYCPSSAPVFSFVPQTPYREFALDHTGDRSSPNPWLWPFSQFLIHPLLTYSIVKYWVCRWWNPSQLPSLQGPWLLVTYWGNVRSGYYSSCYLYLVMVSS